MTKTQFEFILFFQSSKLNHRKTCPNLISSTSYDNFGVKSTLDIKGIEIDLSFYTDLCLSSKKNMWYALGDRELALEFFGNFQIFPLVVRNTLCSIVYSREY